MSLKFPTAKEQQVRTALLDAFARYTWLGVVFTWEAAEVPACAGRSGPFMRFNLSDSFTTLGPDALTGCLIFAGVAHDVRVPYESVVLLVEPQSGELLANFMRPEPSAVCETFDGECRLGGGS